jgi:hypothetical protein
MKKKLTILSLMLFGIYISDAQQITVALHHGGTSQMYYGNGAFQDAYNASANGDTIYLPGNAHYSGIGIAKKLVIIGSGHRPDSTLATGRTMIESDFRFYAGADGSVLEGIYSTSNIYFNNNERVNDVVIRRCNVNSILLEGTYDTSHTCNRVYIEQNVVRGEINCDNSDYMTIRNNIIRYRIRDINANGLIENNILYHQTDWGYWGDNPSNSAIYSVANSLIRNNIFMRYPSHTECQIVGSNNDVRNNIFANTTPECWSSNYFNNYYTISSDTIFVGQTATYTDFSYAHDYHLKTPSLYPGFTAMGVGIYGGTLPYKEGELPFNPHIQTQTIAPATNTNGKLNIDIKVKAQDQ